MVDDEIKSVINDAFLVNRTKLTEEDPYVAILVIQRRFFNAALSKLEDKTNADKAEFMAEFNNSANEVIMAVNKAEQLRQELLLELLQKNDETINGVEERVRGCVMQQLQVKVQQIENQSLGLYYKFSRWVLVTLAITVVFQFLYLWLK